MTSEQYATLIDRAAEICVNKHAGQRDKAGRAYLLHPMRVALRCVTDDERIVAMLHDVIEDTDITAEFLLKQGFPQYIVNAILSVTKHEGESYDEFIARAKRNSIGRQVKIYDLEDNLDVLRIESVTPEITARLNKYLRARRFLLQAEAFEYSSVQPAEGEFPEIEVDQSKDVVDEADRGQFEVVRVVISRSESCRQQRARINQRLAKRKWTGGTDYMQEKISVIMPDRKIIADYANSSTLIKLFEFIGFQRVAELGLKYGRYPIVTKETRGSGYVRSNSSWYVLGNWPTPVVAQYVNRIADALDLYIECDVVPK